MTETQNEQNVSAPVTSAQDGVNLGDPVTEVAIDQLATTEPVAENTVAPAAENLNNENP